MAGRENYYGPGPSCEYRAGAGSDMEFSNGYVPKLLIPIPTLDEVNFWVVALARS